MPDFFSADGLSAAARRKPASIVTSIAMFYDLENPIAFARRDRTGSGTRRRLAFRAELHALDAAHDLV